MGMTENSKNPIATICVLKSSAKRKRGVTNKHVTARLSPNDNTRVSKVEQRNFMTRRITNPGINETTYNARRRFASPKIPREIKTRRLNENTMPRYTGTCRKSLERTTSEKHRVSNHLRENNEAIHMRKMYKGYLTGCCKNQRTGETVIADIVITIAKPASLLLKEIFKTLFANDKSPFLLNVS
jgi:hypothetical protein